MHNGAKRNYLQQGAGSGMSFLTNKMILQVPDRAGVWQVVEEEGRRIRRANGVISMIKPAAAEPLFPLLLSAARPP